ncbi:MAG TPA: hypothetical protein V6D22_20610 [Candidatus Obscuribacterales bacterium]
MKLSAATSEKLKFVGGAIIVLAAAAIMFPGFLSLAWGLWRIFLILLVVGGSSLAIAYATRRLARLKAGENSGRKPACSSTESSALPPTATDL